MTNRLTVEITAVDKATKVVNGINKSIGKAFRPFDDAKRSAGSFYKALGNNDLIKRPVWALEKAGQGVTMFASSFGMAENSVLGSTARVAAALGSIGGPIGGLLAGAAAAAGGIAAVGVRMAHAGMDITRTAKNLNIGTRELQEYRGAARLAGLETGSMDNALGALGTTLYDASAGINQTAAYALSYANISLRKTRDGAIDTTQAFRDIADVVHRMPNAIEQRKFTDMLGISEMLPLLREGSQKLDEFIAQVNRTGGVMGGELLQKHKQQEDAWNRTKQAIDGATTSVGNYLAGLFKLDAVAEKVSFTAGLLARKQQDQEKNKNAKPVWQRMLTFNMFDVWGMAGEAMRERYGKAPEAARSSSGKIDGGAVRALPNTGRSVSGKVGDDAARSAGDASQPRGLRANNPGNLRSWPGAGTAGGFAVFPTPEAGIAAMAKNLAAYQDQHNIRTISGIVHRWAPAADNNDERGYVASLTRQTGFAPDQALDLHDPKVLAPLIAAITKQENGRNPFSSEVIANAVQRAVGQPSEQVASTGGPASRPGDSAPRLLDVRGQGPDAIARAVADAVREGMAGANNDRPVRLEFVNMPKGLSVKTGGGLGQPLTGIIMAPGGVS